MKDAVERTLDRRRGRRLGRLRTVGVTGALLLHALFVTAAAVVPHLAAEERGPLEFVSVDIVPAQALGRPGPPPAPEPEPEPDPEPEPPPPEPEPEEDEEPEPAPPEPEPDVPALPSPDAEEREEAQPEPAPPPPEPETEATPPGRRGSAQGSPTGTSALGAQVSAVSDPDFTYGYYLDRVLAAIERNWRRPRTRGGELETAITFRIGRDGRVSELEVAESSGYQPFDLAGLRAVQSATPLPPLPAGYRKGSLAIKLVIR